MAGNENALDRIIRFIIGAALLYFAWIESPTIAGSLLSAPGALILVVAGVGAVLMITGFAGWCPLYSLLDISRRHKAA